MLIEPGNDLLYLHDGDMLFTGTMIVEDFDQPTCSGTGLFFSSSMSLISSLKLSVLRCCTILVQLFIPLWFYGAVG